MFFNTFFSFSVVISYLGKFVHLVVLFLHIIVSMMVFVGFFFFPDWKFPFGFLLFMPLRLTFYCLRPLWQKPHGLFSALTSVIGVPSSLDSINLNFVFNFKNYNRWWRCLSLKSRTSPSCCHWVCPQVFGASWLYWSDVGCMLCICFITVG